jgi:hypothetical protein
MRNLNERASCSYPQGISARTCSAESSHGSGIIVDGEGEARHALLGCDAEVAKLLKKRQKLLSSIRSYDLERFDEVINAGDKRKERKEEDDRILRAREEEQKRREKEQKRKAELERKRIQDATCQLCYRVFPNAHARAQHCRDAHGLVCEEYCSRAFNSQHALNQPRDAVGHW